MKINWKTLTICLLIPLSAGGLSALLTNNSMKVFESIEKPVFAPPGWLFPVVWSVLYLLMGIASYMVITSGRPYRRAMTAYFAQLICNFVWLLIFFNMGAYLLAFIWLIALIILVTATIILFYKISKTSALLFAPYMVWLLFAGYLNWGIYMLN